MKKSIYGKKFKKMMDSAFEANKFKPIFPYLPFKNRVNLDPADRKKLEVTIFPKIEKLATRPKTKETMMRFSIHFLANLLKAYRKNEKSHGVELSIRGAHAHIQSAGMNEISNHVVETVINFLYKADFIIKVPAEKAWDFKKDKLGVRKWGFVLVHSTIFLATDKLIDLVSGKITEKTCCTCRIEKPVEDFGKQRNGYEKECKACRAERRKLARQDKRMAA